jgi:hypothetical protein
VRIPIAHRAASFKEDRGALDRESFMRRKDLPGYRAWKEMKTRCYNRNRSTWARYGGRGIEVCERWRNSFEAFYEDMGPRPDGCVIDRIDNDGNYEPGNCRWTTQRINSNNAVHNVRLKFKGRTLTVVQWARVIGVSQYTLHDRLKRGWPIEKVLVPEHFGRKLIEFNGESMTAEEWGVRLGVTRKAVDARIKRWGIEAALTTYGRQHKSSRHAPRV